MSGATRQQRMNPTLFSLDHESLRGGNVRTVVASNDAPVEKLDEEAANERVVRIPFELRHCTCRRLRGGPIVSPNDIDLDIVHVRNLPVAAN